MGAPSCPLPLDCPRTPPCPSVSACRVQGSKVLYSPQCLDLIGFAGLRHGVMNKADTESRVQTVRFISYP